MRLSLSCVFVILVAASALLIAEAHEYKVQRFLRERDEILAKLYPTPNDVQLASAEVEKWALNPSISTVRQATTLECKKQFIVAHKRALSGDMPKQFLSSCPRSDPHDTEQKSGGMKSDGTGNHVLFLSSMKDVKRAEKIIAATMAKQRTWKKKETFLLVVDTDEKDADTVAKMITKCKKIANKAGNTRVMQYKEVEAQGLPSSSAVEKPKVPPKPKRVRFAYTLFVSPNDPLWRIHRVINAIYSKEDFFFVHVDTLRTYNTEKEKLDHKDENDAAFQAVMDIMKPFVANGNMKVEAIFDVSWGGVSMLNAELAMAEGLLEMGEWDYWINLSSTDYPLKPIDQLREFMLRDENWGYNFGWGAFQDPLDEEKNKGLKTTFVECEGHSFRVNDKFPLPQGVKLYGGSSWFLLSRPFLEFIDQCLDLGFEARESSGECSMVLMLLDFGQYKLNNEEVFYQTVQANTPHCELIKNEDLRFINWSKDRDDQHTGCMHWEEVDWCGNSPQTMTEINWDEGREKEDRFFSRKYESPVVFDYMDTQLGINTTKTMAPHLKEVMFKALVHHPDPKGQNVARGKVAFASTVQMNEDGKTFGANNAVDGIMTTRWSSEHDDPQYLTVKLGTKSSPFCNITEVRIHWETAYSAVYNLQISTDLEIWKTVYNGNLENRPRPKTKKDLIHVIPINEGKGTEIQGVRIEALKRATRWGHSLWEIQAFGSCDGTTPEEALRDVPMM